MKLLVIDLKETEIVDLGDGEFESRVISSKKHPLLFNHRALRVAKREGILETGLEQELFMFLAALGPDAVKKHANEEEMDIETDDVIRITSVTSLDHMKDLIWCAYVGACSPNSEYLERDDFKDMYDADFEETMQVFVKLLATSLQRSDNNKFAGNLKKFEGKKDKSQKK